MHIRRSSTRFPDVNFKPMAINYMHPLSKWIYKYLIGFTHPNVLYKKLSIKSPDIYTQKNISSYIVNKMFSWRNTIFWLKTFSRFYHIYFFNTKHVFNAVKWFCLSNQKKFTWWIQPTTFVTNQTFLNLTKCSQ